MVQNTENGISESYRRFLSGDWAGMKDIIDTYYDDLVLFLNRYTGNMDDAEDMAEETLLVLTEKRRPFEGKSTFKTWLFGIGRHLTLSRLKKNGRFLPMPSEEMEEMLPAGTGILEELVENEERSALYSAMKKLPEEYKKALWLKYFEEMPSKDVALAMNKTVYSVNGIIKRAKKALSDLLKEEDYEKS